MDIIEFFQQCAGKWFSQRTNHYLANPQLEAGKTDLWIEILSPSDPDVSALCEQYKIEPDAALLGARIKWSGTVGNNERKEAGSTILVPIANQQNPKTGQLLQQTVKLNSPVTGRYILGNDDSLTLITQSPTVSVEERLWFESPNLRLRTSTVKHSDGFSVASFCSEIRMGGAQPPAQVAT